MAVNVAEVIGRNLANRIRQPAREICGMFESLQEDAAGAIRATGDGRNLAEWCDTRVTLKSFTSFIMEYRHKMC